MASAAYRAGEKLHSEYYGEDSDYTRKGGVICSEILMPPHAPPSFSDRETLWNEVRKRNGERKRSLHTVLTLPCRTSFPCRRTSTLRGNFYWTIL